MGSFLAALAVVFTFSCISSPALAAKEEAASPAPLREGTFSMTLGETTVTALKDASGSMPLSIFHGASIQHMKKLAPTGSVEAGVTVFLIRHKGMNILVDTGYGGDKGSLPHLLGGLGITPEMIDCILLTHMHGDHVGGLVDAGKARFPNARVLVNNTELAFWTSEETAKARPESARNIEMVKAAQAAYGDGLVTFGFGAEVMPGITAVDTAGHTPGHTAFLLASGGRSMLFWGDLVHGAALQFARPEICATYDMDADKAVETRKKQMAFLADSTTLVAGAHLPFPAVGQVQRKGNAFALNPPLNSSF